MERNEARTQAAIRAGAKSRTRWRIFLWSIPVLIILVPAILMVSADIRRELADRANEREASRARELAEPTKPVTP